MKEEIGMRKLDKKTITGQLNTYVSVETDMSLDEFLSSFDYVEEEEVYITIKTKKNKTLKIFVDVMELIWTDVFRQDALTEEEMDTYRIKQQGIISQKES